jgi:hypothetical protein
VVAHAIERTGDGVDVAEMLAASLTDIGIDPTSISDSDLAAILDPSALVESRDSLGGSAYASIMSMSAGRRTIAGALRDKALIELARIDERESSVIERARAATTV